MRLTRKKDILSPYTKKQKQIIDYLYQFRFLNTNQFQKLFKHKDPHRVKEWLKDLVDKNYVDSDYKKNTFPHKPTVYSLTKLSRKLLKKGENNDLKVLDLIYRKKELSEQFISHHLTIADLYLSLRSIKEKNSKLLFLTKYELVKYQYLQPLHLDAYIAVKKKKKTTRYFLHLFDPYTPPFVYRKKVKVYLRYYDEYLWQENTGETTFPIVLFVCHSDDAKKHIMHFAKSVFEKQYEEKYALYLSTKDKIIQWNEAIWEKVNIE